MSQADRLILLVILGAATAVMAAYLPFVPNPVEDAAILLRYADMLSQGHGFAYNPGTAPLDGATDLLFVGLTAGLAKAVGVLEAGRWISAMGHLATIAIVYAALRRQDLPTWFAITCACALAVGPGLVYVGAWFGTPLFTAACAVAAWFAVDHMEGRNSANTPWLFGGACSLVILARPDGLAMAIILAFCALQIRPSTRFVAWFIALVGTCTVAILVWRFVWFGHFIPHTFSQKGAGGLHFRSLFISFRGLLVAGTPLLLLLLGNRSRRGLTPWFVLLGWTCLWVLLNDELNFQYRFQYPAIPAALIVASPALRWLPQNLSPRLAGPTLAAVGYSFLAWATTYGGVHSIFTAEDTAAELGQMLRQIGGAERVLATSEAGVLPLYSGWTAIDTWGLNHRGIADAGLVTPAHLDAQPPDLVMFRRLNQVHIPQTNGGWNAMGDVLTDYVTNRPYCLAGAFGATVDDTHQYWVRTDLTDGEFIASTIRNTPHHRPYHPKSAIDFSAVNERACALR
jgi:arabinofuranosyltransferase